MQHISDKFDELYAILEERKRELIERIGNEQDQKLGHVRSLLRRHGDYLEMSVKLVETAIQSMEEPQMAVFLQVHHPQKHVYIISTIFSFGRLYLVQDWSP